MLILDLCGGTGSWSQPYRDAGYCVEVVDPLVDGCDVRLLTYRRLRIHGVLAAPPCTVFSYARNRYPPTEDELRAALSVADACLRIVTVQQPRWWALENPRNKLRRYLGPARLEFYQWEYGDPGHKPTCIWGDFVPPLKYPKPRTKPSTFRTKQENASPKDAITPAGFARAFMTLKEKPTARTCKFCSKPLGVICFRQDGGPIWAHLHCLNKWRAGQKGAR